MIGKLANCLQRFPGSYQFRLPVITSEISNGTLGFLYDLHERVHETANDPNHIEIRGSKKFRMIFKNR